MRLSKKVVFFKTFIHFIFFIGLGGFFSCSVQDSKSEIELNNSVNMEADSTITEPIIDTDSTIIEPIIIEPEIEKIDIESKLASGESFLLPSISGCNYDDVSEAIGVLVESPSMRQHNQISEILRFSGLPSNFQILKTTNEIKNAFAVTFQDQRLIVFDEELLLDVEKGSDTYWSSMSILAHEVGHHLSGHTLDSNGSNPKNEMEADRFSGFVLFKMGASLDEAKYAMQSLGSESDSETHPSKLKRLGYIEDGWNEAQGQRAFATLPPPPHDDGEEFRYYSPEHLLSYDIYNDLYLDKSRSYGLIEDVEGIIVRSVDSKDYFHYDVFLTALTKDHEHLQTGEIFTFGMENPINAFKTLHKFERDTFTKMVMIPGRKIRFTLNTEGNQGNYSITKVEVLQRTLEN